MTGPMSFEDILQVIAEKADTLTWAATAHSHPTIYRAELAATAEILVMVSNSSPDNKCVGVAIRDLDEHMIQQVWIDPDDLTEDHAATTILNAAWEACTQPMFEKIKDAIQ